MFVYVCVFFRIWSAEKLFSKSKQHCWNKHRCLYFRCLSYLLRLYVLLLGSLKAQQFLHDKQKHYVLYLGTGARVLNENITKKYLTSEKENIPLKRETEELILTKDSGKHFTSSAPNGKAGKHRTELFVVLKWF